MQQLISTAFDIVSRVGCLGVMGAVELSCLCIESSYRNESDVQIFAVNSYLAILIFV